MHTYIWKKRMIVVVLFLIAITGGCGQTTTTTQSEAGKPPAPQEEQVESKGYVTSGEVFRIGHLPATIDLLYFVAQEKGYFSEEGLTTELIEFGNSGEGINAILAEKLDVGAFGTAAPLSFIDRGADNLTIIGGAGGKGNGIIALPERAAEFTDLTSYQGKKVGTVKLSNGDAVWRKGLVDAGLDWKTDVEIVELDTPASVLQAVKNKSVDAGVVWAPFMEIAKEQGLVIVQYTDDFFPGHPCCRQLALSENLEQKKGDYIAFFRALIRAEEFYREHKEETIDIVTKYVKVDRHIIEADAYGGELLISADPNKRGVEEYWQGMQDIGYVTSEKAIAQNINIAFYEEALRSLLEEQPDNSFLQELQDTFREANL